MKKILLFCNKSNDIINFRKELIIFLKENDYEVSIIAGDDDRKEDLKGLGIDFYLCKFSNRSANPFSLHFLIRKFLNIAKKVKPDVIFSFQAKPNILGMRVAHSLKVKQSFAMIEGLGDPFQPHGLKGHLIMWGVTSLYKHSLKYAKNVFFLNRNDREEFIKREIIPSKKSVVIQGIGIDVDKYSKIDSLPAEKNVLILTRLIPNKGIKEICEIAKKVKSIRSDINFRIFGEESDIKAEDLKEYILCGYIEYKGFTKNVINEFKHSRLLLTCSYREGFPRSILEAMALGRTVLATDVIGNRHAVVDGKSGFLLPVHAVDEFANKIIEIIDDDKLLMEMGNYANAYCKEHYDAKVINNKILDIISKE